jgi:hypothetical protein
MIIVCHSMKGRKEKERKRDWEGVEQVRLPMRDFKRRFATQTAACLNCPIAQNIHFTFSVCHE